MRPGDKTSPGVPRFSRDGFESGERISRIGGGSLGGKAKGLIAIRQVLAEKVSPRFPGIDIDIPAMVVIGTDHFGAFMDGNALWDIALSHQPDNRIAHAFQQADLPVGLVGDLRALIETLHTPVAVRSSSMLEDALYRPFAGVYGTKMTPNNQPDPNQRFQALVDAIKYVWASTFFKAAKSYIRATQNETRDEKMAVIIQEVVGRRHDQRFYPDLSGVGRSYNFYPVGSSKQEDGVVNLALGLGKAIVDGGITWTYSPARPKAPPPFASVAEQSRNTQLGFWSINMGKTEKENPLLEDEHLLEAGLAEADRAGVLRYLASTIDARSGRLNPGTGSDGPRILNFAPLLVLEEWPLNEVTKSLLQECETALGGAVEIEFAATIDPKAATPLRLGFLQVRPMVVCDEQVELDESAFDASELLVGSRHVLGNGITRTVRNVVYVKPENFEARHTSEIAKQLESINNVLLAEDRPYLLIGFGRWGSSDPWLGVPVDWGQICGARAIVEATLPAMNVDPSQGSHFFHNISSFGVSYFAVHHEIDRPIAWDWLAEQEILTELRFVRSVRLKSPLEIKVDGRKGLGGIWHSRVAPESVAAADPGAPALIEPLDQDRPIGAILTALQERAKELNCVYRVDEILLQAEDDLESTMATLVRAVPPGWQFVDSCEAELRLAGSSFSTPGYVDSPWKLTAAIVDQGEAIGEISVVYTSQRPTADEGPFLREERKLINTIAERIGYFVMKRRLHDSVRNWENAVDSIGSPGRRDWRVILEFLQQADSSLLARLTRRMINELCWRGVREARQLLRNQSTPAPEAAHQSGEENVPLARLDIGQPESLAWDVFQLAAEYIPDEKILSSVQAWIKQDKARFLVDTVESQASSLSDISSVIERFQSIGVQEEELPLTVQTGIRVALLRRFFTADLGFINTAKDLVTVRDFHELLPRVITSGQSHGKLGGKSAGLFLAEKALRSCVEHHDLFKEIRVPKTWYLSSDTLVEFVHYNHLDDIYCRKYMELDRIRQEYSHVIQLFKNSSFLPEILIGLERALEDLGDRPIIVRSSSLLEDSRGSAFSGKYKSLFLANQGSRDERLRALTDAISEVYASVFGPDPIEYRAERDLLDVHEEMGVMIQEVVGKRVGKYFLPAFSGVALSNNEFRWSPRIERGDGLVRLVPGLGTRAVDRIGDDFPVLLAPGKPELRVNVSPEEIARYSPRKLDLVNLETNSFETVDVMELLREVGTSYPAVLRLVSEFSQGQVTRPSGLMLDFDTRDYVVTFDGLITRTPFISQMHAILTFLQDKMGHPVDLEFASDGQTLFLLQCRPQSRGEQNAPAAIPRDLREDRILFSANRFVSDGRVSGISHVVYVDPDAYDELTNLDELQDVGRTIGRLNKALPKRGFLLMGPGRWGSRGDIKLGVKVTYSDINNAAVLIEIAKHKSGYVPDLSFGTHFFQDLVEAGIRYLPLYPDEEGTRFNWLFFQRAKNLLKEILPDAEQLASVVRVIDIGAESDGLRLDLLMNADLDEAVAVLASSSEQAGDAPIPSVDEVEGTARETSHWRWRQSMAEKIARTMDAEEFGVEAIYVFGSTKNANAGAGSDIDLLVHVEDTDGISPLLEKWLDAWSCSLAEMNYLRTGHRCERLLDIHYVNDDDIASGTSYAAKIGAVTDAARKLPLG